MPSSVIASPPTNLHQVSPTLFRSEQLDKDDEALLHALGIRTIINLRYFDRDDDREHFGDSGITLINIPLLTWSISVEEMAQVLHAIAQGEQRGNVLVHCYHGSDRTGLTVGLYRIIYQHWSIRDAEREMRHGGYGYHKIWRNIARFYTPEKIAAVRQALQVLQQKDAAQSPFK